MSKIVVKIQWLIAGLLWIYIFYRAVSIGITQDEAYSYYLVRTNNWRAMPGSLNTHWLNTLGMRLFLWLPGADRVWKLRMLSVLSWWLYSFSAIKLSSGFKNRFIGFAFFLASVLNPFLVFYFSLGRGYALACAFILYSVWQACRTIRLNQTEPSEWVKVFLPACIAVCANFSSFYFLIGITVVYITQLVVNREVPVLFRPAASGLNCIFLATALFATVSLLFIRYHTKEFEGSESSDFISSLFSSQIRYGNHLVTGDHLLPPGVVLFTVSTIFALFSAYRYFAFQRMTIGVYCMLTVGIVVLCNAVFHLLFGTPFLYGRTGLMFYVASLPAFFFTADSWMAKWKFLQVGLETLMLMIAFVFALNFYKGFSPGYFSEFPVQADTEKSLDYIQQLNARHAGLSLWHYSVFMNYYSLAFPGKYQFGAFLIDENVLDPRINDCDYLIMTLPASDKNRLQNNWIVKWRNPATRTMILSKKQTFSADLSLSLKIRSRASSPIPPGRFQSHSSCGQIERGQHFEDSDYDQACFESDQGNR